MYQRILVPVDGSATAHRGLEEAIRIARSTGGRLRLIHVVDERSTGLGMGLYAGNAGPWIETLRGAGQQLLEQARAVVAGAGIEVETSLRDDLLTPVHELIAEEASRWQAELIVIGTHGRRGVERLVLGSCAESLLRCAPVPVLLVRTVPAARGVETPAASSVAE